MTNKFLYGFDTYVFPFEQDQIDNTTKSTWKINNIMGFWCLVMWCCNVNSDKQVTK